MLLMALWTALYSNHDAINGIDLETMKFYTVASIIFGFFIASTVEKSVTARIRDGSISIAMTRPVSYPVTIFVEQLAYTVQNLVLRVGPYILLAVVFRIGAGANAYWNPALIASMLLAYLLMLFFQMFFGMIAFWTFEIDGLLQVRDALMLVFSGSMIPLWFFPDWLFNIARFLPFQAIYNIPLSILIGRIEGAAVWDALLTQLIWLCFFFGLSVFFWSKTKHRVVVNGG
jgi:ABC-2 type transport system permease protein